MEINPKKIRCVEISSELLNEIDLKEIEEALECKLILKTPLSYNGTVNLAFYSENFEEEEVKKNWVITVTVKENNKRVFEWLK